jgi:inosine/xanthosine triphosphate pyrophosphatase family protein
MVVFVTANRHKRAEVATLLAGLDVRFARLDLAPATGDARHRATTRVEEAYARLREPCFVEAAELRVRDEVYSGAAFKKALEAEGDAFFARLAGPAEVRVAVALAVPSASAGGFGAASIEVFEGALEGTLLGVRRGTGGYGWDAAFVPSGAPSTLAELASQKAWVNVRTRPFLELADRLRGRRYGGVFEAHVTVRTEDPAELERFATWVGALGAKAIFIALPEGATLFQPMTGSYHHGELPEVQAEVFALARRLTDAGFEVTRVKIEATGSNRDVPRTDEEARARYGYFEVHLKVSLPPGADVEALRAQVAPHEGRLSRNARRIDGDVVTRFVTLRIYGRGLDEARRRHVALHHALVEAGYRVADALLEYTVYDSDVGLDAGWGA